MALVVLVENKRKEKKEFHSKINTGFSLNPLTTFSGGFNTAAHSLIFLPTKAIKLKGLLLLHTHFFFNQSN